MAIAKFDIKSVQTEATKSAQRALHAGVGATDLAVEVVRDYVAEAQKLAQKAQEDLATRVTGLQKSVIHFEPKAFRAQAAKDAKARRAAIEKRVAQLQSQIQSEAAAVPAKVQKSLDAPVSTATDLYGDLVKRGEMLVGRIRRQQSTKDTVSAAETTVAKAKTTKTQATKAAKKTTTHGQEDHGRQEALHRPAEQRQGDDDRRQEDGVGGLARPGRRRREGRRLNVPATELAEPPGVPRPRGLRRVQVV